MIWTINLIYNLILMLCVILQRVLEKSGMHFVKMSQYNGVDVTYYEIQRQLSNLKVYCINMYS